ncbi:MAG: hypothetical protein J0M10_15075 [Chitinophagales bacterium]|nr:hypothetical protein [Chitinophagales bacterium]
MHYSGNDTLPFRYDVISGNSHASSFYSYSGNFVATDSTSGFNGINNYKQVTQFSSLRPGWYLLKSVRETDLNPGVFETVDSTIFSRTYTSGNIISTVDSVWSSGLLDYVESSQYQYDQNKGPLRRFQLFFNGYYESAVPTISFPSLNNITSESNFNSISGSLILSASHTIATSGYPAVSRINGMIEFNKYIYEYINL